MTKISKSKRRRGSEMLEFSLAFLPLLMMTLIIMDVSWAIFVKSTLAYAVRTGLRVGVTTTGTQATAAGLDLTSLVKRSVAASAQGLLGRLPTDPRRATIKVHYYQPLAGSTQDVCADLTPNGLQPGYIMTVSIEGYSLGPLTPRIMGWNTGIDNSATNIATIAADRIEPSRDLPTRGLAP
jgi:Flp pilus assembly protein TadG